ncbi:type IV toxin-antitoxin system AbiEi family antitoxin [Hymenobacter sp. HD11105]
MFINSEHTRIVNTFGEEQLILWACQALEASTGLSARLEAFGREPRPPVAPGDHRGNGCLRIGPQEQLFIVNARLRVQPETIGNLRALQPTSREPVVLIVPYISDQQGEKLRHSAIHYLDTAGNAYLQSADRHFFVLVRGQRQPLAAQPTPHRAFQPAGVQLLYHLLSEPALLQATYRTMAGQAQVALGSVSILLRSLQQLGLLRDEAGERRWTEPAHVLRRWVDAYGEVVRPKLTPQRYRWLDPGVARQGWQQVELGADMAWGGEPAAHLLLEGYLLPEYFTLYTTASRSEVMRRLRLIPDAQGTIEVLRPMETTLAKEHRGAPAVHPLVVYADLIRTTDPRNREVALRLYARYLSYLS